MDRLARGPKILGKKGRDYRFVSRRIECMQINMGSPFYYPKLLWPNSGIVQLLCL